MYDDDEDYGERYECDSDEYYCHSCSAAFYWPIADAPGECPLCGAELKGEDSRS